MNILYIEPRFKTTIFNHYDAIGIGLNQNNCSVTIGKQLKKYNLDTPILDSIYKILVKGYSVKKIVNLLLARPLKKE